MAIFQSNLVKKGHLLVPFQRNVITPICVTHVIGAAWTAASDILELAALPAFCRILRLRLNSENITTNWTLGFMSGTYGSTDPARTSGSELLSAVTGGTEQSVPLNTLAGLTVDLANVRSIGLKASSDQTAGSTKKIHLWMEIAAMD